MASPSSRGLLGATLPPGVEAGWTLRRTCTRLARGWDRLSAPEGFV